MYSHNVYNAHARVARWFEENQTIMIVIKKKIWTALWAGLRHVIRT